MLEMFMKLATLWALLLGTHLLVAAEDAAHLDEDQFWGNMFGENEAEESAHLQNEMDEHMGFHWATADMDRDFKQDGHEFMLFRLHDSDANNHLDGLELLAAIMHSSHHHDSQHSLEFDKATRLIDSALSSADKDLDGELDFAEFVSAKKSHLTQIK